jgi:hypothetical protein
MSRRTTIRPDPEQKRIEHAVPDPLFFGEGKTDIFLGGPIARIRIFLVWSGSSLSGADGCRMDGSAGESQAQCAACSF